ncbi:CHAP domain containing protein [Bifidobacterium thermophilum]|nr:CHAP domain containing protein [Bifidobacterium thermophilum]
MKGCDMKRTKKINAIAGVLVASLTLIAAGTANLAAVQPAQAVTMQQYKAKLQSQSDLKAKLAGVSSQLADQILELNDLNQNQIPAAQQALQDAQNSAEQAQAQAQAASERLDAAKQDKADLEEQIKQTGADYDDAKAAVAQMARDSFHGTTASEVMNVVTNSSTTEDFVNKMQADAAVSRTESNAANDAATQLSTAKNREQRLAAIEDEITALKQKADAQAAAAQRAVETAQDKQSELNDLLAKGNAARESLESQKSQLTSQSAKEAAEIVAMESEINSWSSNYENQQASPSSGGSQAASGRPSSAGANNSGSSGSHNSNTSRPSQPSTPSQPSRPSNSGSSSSSNSGVSGMNYSVPGNCPAGSSFCYGHSTGNVGNAYPARQCTWWAYIRRQQLGLPVGSYLGNGAQWASKARALGYLVNNTPHVGAAMVFAPGQRVTNWYANAAYGHVAIVERVNSDGSVLISEGGTKCPYIPYSEVVYNASSFQYVHY